jgi:hypothetical protein
MNLFFPGMCMLLARGLLGLWAQSTSIKDKMVANETSKGDFQTTPATNDTVTARLRCWILIHSFTSSSSESRCFLALDDEAYRSSSTRCSWNKRRFGNGKGALVVPQSLWHYDTLSLRYMTSQQNIQSPPS